MAEVEEALDKLGLTSISFKILCYLTFRQAPAKPKDLLEAVGPVSPSTVRARLSELRKMNLVEAGPEGYVSKVTAHDILMKLYREIIRKMEAER
mgnify:CR=1 FL=1